MDTLKPTPRAFSGEDSKSSDPASVDDPTKLAEGTPGSASDLLGPPAANRHRLQNERSAITHHFSFGGHEGYLTVGLYPNGQPGEIFIRMAKAGSTIAGLMECFGTVVSVSLQHGVPLKVLCDKLSHTRLSLPAGRATRRSGTRSRSWTTFFVGWSCGFCPENNSRYSAKAVTRMAQAVS